MISSSIVSLQRTARTLPHTPAGQVHAAEYLHRIGVPDLPPRTASVDPGYDPLAVESHLEQSAHLMEALKISMACWMIADESITRRKVTAATHYGVPTVTGGGAFEVAVAQGQLEPYLDLCADIGVTRIECCETFINLRGRAHHIVKLARERRLEVQFGLGKKHAGALTEEMADHMIDQGNRWLEAGALLLVVEARETLPHADSFAHAFGLETVTFKTPNKPSQFALLDQFGREVHLSGVRLEDLLRVETYRRGLHSDAFGKKNLRLPRLEGSTGRRN